MMWLPLLVLSVTTHVPPINASETSNEEQPVMYRPSTLDDCKNVVEWKSFYKLCVRIANQAPESLLWEEGELTSLPNHLANPIYPEYEGVSSNELLADSSDDDATTKDLAVGDFTFGKRLRGHGGDFLRLKKEEGLGLPTLHSGAVLRRRRQHSLSINSALVSLADMLIAKDYNRKQSRQKDFRQQLLGLGR